MLSAVLLGFALGLRHALDPDHVIAVSALAARERRPWGASWLALTWSLGHGVTILVVGLGAIALHVTVPDGMARSMELAVGAVLVVLGLANLTAAPVESSDALGSARAMRSALRRSALVGLIHGLAGSAAITWLALTSVPSAQAGLIFLLLFCLGTVCGMAGFSLVLGAPFAWLVTGPGLQRWLVAGTGAASLLFGAWLILGVLVR
jgi:hypothetical protein